MSQETLLEALDEDARNQAKSIIQSAEAEAAVLIATAGEEAAVMINAILVVAGRGVDRARAEVMNGARVRAAAALIDCRRTLMDEVFKRADLAFSSLDRREYGSILSRWYDEMKAAWDQAGLTGEPIVFVNPADFQFLDKSSVILKTDPLITHGIVFVSADGKVRFENTFASRLDRSKEELLPFVDRILSGAEGHGQDSAMGL